MGSFAGNFDSILCLDITMIPMDARCSSYRFWLLNYPDFYCSINFVYPVHASVDIFLFFTFL